MPGSALTVGLIGAAALLTVLYALALAVGSAFDPGSRTATARAAALAAGAALVLLAADEASYVTGATVAVTGGRPLI